MSDYEILNLMFLASADITEKLAVLMSTLSAFLMASIFVAKKLNKRRKKIKFKNSTRHSSTEKFLIM